MSKRIILTPEKVTPSLYQKLSMLSNPFVQAMIVETFKLLSSRRKCYKLKEFHFQAHATEYFFDDFFDLVQFAGFPAFTVAQNSENLHLVRALVSLANIFGHDIYYDDMITLLESTLEARLTDGHLIEIIPEMLYAYTTQFKPQTLVFKLEYFFGTDVIHILDSKGYEVNTGRERQNPERARRHAAFLLKDRAQIDNEQS